MTRVKGNGYISRETTLSKLFRVPSEKWVYSEMKEVALMGATFFPFRVDSLSEGTWCEGKQTGSHESCLPCQK